MQDVQNLLSKFQNELVILIDLSWILYRSHYAYADLTNSEGEPTGQYYGLSRNIITLKEHYPSALIFLVDDGCPLERKELNESYKANRDHSVHFDNKKHTVDCIIQNVPNVFRIYNPIAEADDMMFSISRIKDYNNKFIIYSSDKDLFQSIDSTTTVASEIKNGLLLEKDCYHEQYIKHFQDLQPFQVPFYRAVLGDPSDNLKIIRPRFPSKIAYYFAKNYVSLVNGTTSITKPTGKPIDLTDKQYENLLEIYSSTEFINNLRLMRLKFNETIPIMDKVKTPIEVDEIITKLELHQFKLWLNSTY